MPPRPGPAKGLDRGRLVLRENRADPAGSSLPVAPSSLLPAAAEESLSPAAEGSPLVAVIGLTEVPPQAQAIPHTKQQYSCARFSATVLMEGFSCSRQLSPYDSLSLTASGHGCGPRQTAWFLDPLNPLSFPIKAQSCPELPRSVEECTIRSKQQWPCEALRRPIPVLRRLLVVTSKQFHTCELVSKAARTALQPSLLFFCSRDIEQPVLGLH
jgi:hypothetical protein